MDICNMPPAIRSFLLLVFLLWISKDSLRAQNVVVAGEISGRITDLSGAAIPDADVGVMNAKTGVAFSSVANHSGIYRFVLSPGIYSVTAIHRGFRAVRVDQIPVLIGNTTAQDIKLTVGASEDVITVIATNPLLRPTESSVTMVVERTLLEDLPLSRRRYTDFTTLTPEYETVSTSYNTTPSGELRDGATLNQTCYLVPNSGLGNFGTLQEFSPNGLPRILQFCARFAF
jgi:Carboxypeptidase regulatory-like domain